MTNAITQNRIKTLSYILWIMPMTMVFDLLNSKINAGESFFYFILHRIYHFSYEQRDLDDKIVLIVYTGLIVFTLFAVYRFGKKEKKKFVFLLFLSIVLCASIVVLFMNGRGWWNFPYEIGLLLSRLFVFAMLIRNIGTIKRVNASLH